MIRVFKFYCIDRHVLDLWVFKVPQVNTLHYWFTKYYNHTGMYFKSFSDVIFKMRQTFHLILITDHKLKLTLGLPHSLQSTNQTFSSFTFDFSACSPSCLGPPAHSWSVRSSRRASRSSSQWRTERRARSPCGSAGSRYTSSVPVCSRRGPLDGHSGRGACRR